MDLGWLQSLFYGLISGFSEFLPVSADAHRALFLKLSGGQDGDLVRLMVHFGALLALLITCGPAMSRLNRERRIARMSPKRRRRPPDEKRLQDIRLLKASGIVLLLGYMLYPVVRSWQGSLWILAIGMLINGIFLYYPQLLPSGNREGASLSLGDRVLIGLGSALGCIPGLSRVGVGMSVGLARGADRRFILDMALILSLPALIILMLFDVIGMFGGLGAIGFLGFLKCLLAGLGAFGGAWAGVLTARFLAVRAGFHAFAYYCWGAALFSFVLYLTI